jgi:signal transduction histidine kinase
VFLVALLVGMVTAVVVRGGPPAYPGSTLLILSLASWLPLLVRSRWPLVVLASTVVVEILHLVVVPFTGTSPTAGAAMGAYQPVPIATMVAAYTMAGRRSGWRAWVPGGVAAVALFVVSLIAQPLHLIGTDVVLLELVVIATGVGVLVTGRRERSQRLERERLEATRREVIAERLRIARDLHDVLAHHLAVVNAQAGVAEYLMRTDPQTASTALHDIALNTRKALDELRATVGLLRQDDEPAPPGDDDPRHPLPGLDRLEELLAGFRSAGATVALTVTGSPRALAPGGDLAAYRIVQEALTNATKHAPGAPVDVTLHWLRRRLDLRIANGPGPGLPHDHRGPGTGHGLIGMRERALTCGGTLTAEPSPAGGFAVNATIPEYDDPDTPADSATTPASPPEVTP